VNTTAAQPDGTWRVGELAARTGLTVRTLHHYHEIGLLVPSLHSEAGHRRYTSADVRRLHRILALRGFGFALAEIGEILDEAPIDPRALFQRQLDQVDAQIAASHQLRQGLLGVLGELDNRVEPESRTMIELIEVMITMQHTLTPEQFAEMSAKRAEFAATLSATELAEMAEWRRQFTAGLSAEELTDMQRRRAALLPWQPGPAEEV
jgi:DNA-binding transcriptional MerR regulator